MGYDRGLRSCEEVQWMFSGWIVLYLRKYLCQVDNNKSVYKQVILNNIIQ